MGIRWRAKDKSNLQRKVRNYNAKRNRLIEKGIKEEYIPVKMSYRELKKNIQDRQDLETHLDIIKAFTIRGSENIVTNNKGLKVPAYIKNMSTLKVKSINDERKKRKKYYNEIEVTSRGKKVGISKEKFPDLNVNKIREKHFNFDKMTTQNFGIFLEGVNRLFEIEGEEKKKQYRENYYKAIDNNLSVQQAEELKIILDKIDTDTMVEKYYTDLDLDINFYYDEHEQQAKFETMRDAWKDILKEQSEGD